MKNRDYWKKRFAVNQQNLLKTSDENLIELERTFKGALNDIEKETALWYQRFADNNGITDMAEARRLLTGSELKELKWNVNEYIKHGKENGITADWNKELENASARYHISRLESLKLQTRQHIETLYNTYFDSTDGLLKNAYKNSYYNTGYETALGTGIGTSFSKIDEGKLQRVMSKPWSADGTNFSEKIWNDRTKLVNTLHNELTRGIITGKKPDEIIKNISKTMSTSYSNAKRLVMTESAFFSSAGQFEAYKELNVQKFEVLGTFDNRFCSLCEEFDGKVFELKDFETGVTAPPFHPNCRCTTVPYFDDEFTAGEQRAARDENGKTVYVDSQMSYEEWQERLVKESVDINLKSDIILSDEEQRALNEYISSGSYKINEKLRIGMKLDKDEENFVKSLDSVLDKMNNYKGDLGRVVNFMSKDVLDEFVNSHVIGKVKTYDEYLSTTKSDISAERADVKIYIENSSKGKDISMYNPKEDEILYQRESKFNVKNKEFTDGTWYILLEEV